MVGMDNGAVSSRRIVGQGEHHGRKRQKRWIDTGEDLASGLFDPKARQGCQSSTFWERGPDCGMYHCTLGRLPNIAPL